MDREEYDGLPQVPRSCGEVDGLQSRKRIGVASFRRRRHLLIWWGTADDLFQVQATFLLPLWVET